MWDNFSGKRRDTGRNREAESGHWGRGWWSGVRGGFFPCLIDMESEYSSQRAVAAQYQLFL